MRIDICEYCGNLKKDFEFSLLGDLDMKRRPKWMREEYALAQESGHETEFEKYAFTQVENICYHCEFDDVLPKE